MVSISDHPLHVSYADTQKAAAVSWKLRTATLPEEAKAPAPYIDKHGDESSRTYGHCLPAPFAHLSLLPEVRDVGLELFAELGIPWHAGVGNGPSNNLVSSQVQCVNALGQMVSDPDRIIRAFAEPLGTVDVLPIEPGRFMTFEYIGPEDFLGEAVGGARTRGANCTSVDAAFLQRNSAGHVELILIEWKYIESYWPRQKEPGKDSVRRHRYTAVYEEPSGPVRSDLLDLDVMFQEPLYQLMRQQMLAYRLEQAGAQGCQRARVVHVLPPGNTAYQQSLHQKEAKALGTTVSEVWSNMLRCSDRFVPLDPAVFLDPAITSAEYVSRYGAAA